jgi:predicted negative regulator of RcsB-dependent stress response
VDDLQSEKEQIEEIRAWWAEYGRYIIAGVVIAVGLLVGYNQYQGNKLAAQREASVLFEKLTEHVDAGDLERAEQVAGDLENDYANTAYAPQSKLAMASLYMDKNRDQDAVDVLTELVNLRGNSEIRHVGRIRLARILLYQDKPEDVIALLEDQEAPAFAARYAESLGDAWALLGDVDKAAEAYRAALADTSQSVNRNLVQMKLADLPRAPASAAAAEDVADDTDAMSDGEAPAAEGDPGEAATVEAGEPE